MKETYNMIWSHIINTQKIDLSKPFSCITSKQIKSCKHTWKGEDNQFEPRLLCKQDNTNSRPNIFKENSISILAINNGKYGLIKDNIYKELVKDEIEARPILNKHNSILLQIGDSETSMLDNLYYNSILDEIIGEPILYGPLLGGRHRCHFECKINNLNLEIKGVQYETDACYETLNNVCIVEAKSIDCDDFNIRQLYLPYREVYKHVGNKKNIIALFICKDKQKNIHVYKFNWYDPNNMLDIHQTKYYKFKFIDS